MVRATGTVAALCERRQLCLPMGLGGHRPPLQDLRSVIPDRFDRTAFHCFFAESFLFRLLRLLVDVGMAAVVVPLEIGRRGFTAQIAIDALIIDIEFARYVFSVFVRYIGHGFSLKMKWNVRKKRPICKVISVLTRLDV